MADPKSTLIPNPEPNPNPKYSTGLRKFREDPKQTINLSFQAPRFDVLFGSSPMKYSTENKKKWWDTKDDKPFKIGLIHSKELDTRISIYGEVFDFSKTATRNGPSEPLQPEELKEVKAIGFESSENIVEEPILQPETYFTSKDFDRMYLGWLEPTDKIRRSILKQLFRFVFGNKKMADVKKFQTRLLIAYTPLTPNEKVPCDSELRNDFRTAIEYRRNNLIQETRATKQAIGEDTLYMEKKQKVLMGLRDVLNTMDTKEEQCLLYGDNPDEENEANTRIQKKDLASRSPEFSDDDFRRLVFIFQNYIDNQGKFKGKNIPVQGRELYEDILKLLKVTFDPSSMVDGEELEDMTKMVEVLSFLLKTFAELHSIHIQLFNIKHALTKRNLEDLGKQNEDLEERIRSLTTSMEKGDTDISRLLYRFAQSILKKSEDNSETIRKQILGYVEGKEQEIRFQKDDIEEMEKQLKDINEERMELLRQLDQIETDLSFLRDQAVPAFQELIEELEKTLQDKTVENTVLQQRLQECEQLRQELTTQLEQLYEQRERLTNLLQNTVTALEQMRTLYDALRIEDTTKAEEIQSLLTQETTIQEMREMILNLNEEASAVANLLQTLQQQLITVKTQKQELEGRLQITETRLVESKAREEELVKITEQTSTAFQQLYSRAQTLLDALEVEEIKIQQMVQERDGLRVQLEELTKQIEESKKKESVLQKEKDDCEERLKKLLEESTIHSEEKDRQIKELEGRLEVLSKEITNVVGHMQDLYIQRDTLEAETQLAQVEHETERLRIQAEKDVLEEQLKGMVDPQRVAELEQQLQDLEKEKQSLLQEAEQKRQQNIANLQTTHTKTVDDLRSENERQQKSFEDIQQALSQAREALTILQGVKGESDIEVSNLQKQIKMLEEQHVKALEDFSEASRLEADAKIASAIKEMSEQQADIFKERLAKLKEDEQKREERFIELEKRLQGEVQASEEEKERIRVEYEAESEELTRIIQRKNEEIDSILISLKTSEEEKEELQVEVEILQAENAGLREEVAKLSQQVGRLSEELGTLIEEITEIKRPSGIVRGMVHDIHQKEGQQKERPAWKPVSTGTSRGPTQKTVITRKAGQGGGGKDSCETMLTLLLFHLKENKYDVQAFLDKAGATLDDLGQCPLVLHLLNEMLGEALSISQVPSSFGEGEASELQTEKGAVLFSPVQNETSKLVLESLENAIQGRFTEEEQDFLSSLSKPITFYSHPPERFANTLGSEPYILYDDGSKDVVLKGVGEEDIHLTNEERDMIEDGGVSLGAVTFLYLNCLQDMARLNDTTYSPTEVSKCLRAQRSQERAKTPKQKHKRKPQRKA